ncbi:MAG: DUF4129 domain-containing protein [TACK group archaeon]|nr:DUF4129 domain-containing protein [TACK group archaeon]
MSTSRGMALAFIGAAILVIWIVSSSITVLPLQSTSEGSVGRSSGPPGTGSGSGGLGLGLGGLGLGGKGFGINLSATSITVPKFGYNFTAPNATSGSLLFLQLPVISFRIPLPGIKAGPLNMSSLGIKLGAGGGGSGGQGKSGKSSTSTKAVSTPIVLPNLEAFVYVLIALIVAIVAFALLKGTRRQSVREVSERPSEKGAARLSKIMAIGTKGRADRQSSVYLFKGAVVPYKAWGGSRFLELPVPQDIPLTWRVSDPLPYALAEGAILRCYPECRVEANRIRFERIGCYSLEVRSGDYEELHPIRVVSSYREDVMGSFRANLSGIEDALTPRETCQHLFNEKALDERPESWATLRVFEACRYGDREPDRKTYELFLRELQKLNGSVVMGCESEQ